jgi:hypothetical protein
VQGYQPVKYKCSPLSPWLDTKLSEYNAFLVLFYTSWASHFKFLLVRVAVVGRKILVLDLDETLIHSHHDGYRLRVQLQPHKTCERTCLIRCRFTLARQVARPSYPPDFILKVREYVRLGFHSLVYESLPVACLSVCVRACHVVY